MDVEYNIIYIDKIIPNQPPEKDTGNKEYKRLLYKTNNMKYVNKKATQMLYRIMEGNGKATYLIGIDDDGKAIGITMAELNETLSIIKQISNIIKANIKKIRIYKSKNNNNIMSIRIIK
jgi:elongation factor 1-alpha